ncbi:MAG: tetratricopeptide repeat protein, partial [Bryobacterales bacterium]|nr:tetratricopeptide repeat protein [Bryobacterales bacterium]
MNIKSWFTTTALAMGLALGSDFSAELEPPFDHSDLDRGVQLFHAGKFAEAQTALNAAVEAEPGSARAHEYLGRTWLALRKYPEAQAELAKSDTLAPDN